MVYLSVREVGGRLGISKSMVLDLIRSGQLPGSRKKNPVRLTSAYEVPEEAVREFERKRTEASK